MKILLIGIVSVVGAFSGVFAGQQYIEAQTQTTTFTGLVVASDSEPIVLHVEPSQRIVGVESLQGGEDNTAIQLQPAQVQSLDYAVYTRIED